MGPAGGGGTVPAVPTESSGADRPRAIASDIAIADTSVRIDPLENAVEGFTRMDYCKVAPAGVVRVMMGGEVPGGPEGWVGGCVGGLGSGPLPSSLSSQ